MVRQKDWTENESKISQYPKNATLKTYLKRNPDSFQEKYKEMWGSSRFFAQYWEKKKIDPLKHLLNRT